MNIDKIAARIQKNVVVDEAGCWLWQHPSGSTDYGCIGIDGKTYRAHRISYQVFNGPIPDKQLIRHRCDVKNCVNPAHLELGTSSDNLLDRYKRSEEGRAFTLTAVQEDEIRQKYTKGNGRALAKEYNIHPTTVYQIVKRHAR